jgi:hypothetical protein
MRHHHMANEKNLDIGVTFIFFMFFIWFVGLFVAKITISSGTAK